jgi:hypothetical protein
LNKFILLNLKIAIPKEAVITKLVNVRIPRIIAIGILNIILFYDYRPGEV